MTHKQHSRVQVQCSCHVCCPSMACAASAPAPGVLLPLILSLRSAMPLLYPVSLALTRLLLLPLASP